MAPKHDDCIDVMISSPHPQLSLSQPEKPKRPLSAYNVFFKIERQRMLGQAPCHTQGKSGRCHGKIGFAELARSVAAKWKKLDDTERAHYEGLAAQDMERYRREKSEWKQGLVASYLGQHRQLPLEIFAPEPIEEATYQQPSIQELASKLDLDCQELLIWIFCS